MTTALIIMERPTSVTVFGILNLVFVLCGLGGSAFSLLMFAAPAGSANPVIRMMHESPTYATWMKISIPLGAVGLLCLLLSGIGLLLMKPWGRVLAICYGIYAVVMGVVMQVVNYFVLFQPLLERTPRFQGPAAMAAIGGAIGGLLGGCLGLIYPVLLLIFMTRPRIVAAFHSATAPPRVPLT